jgi:Terpene cyclase DEP1
MKLKTIYLGLCLVGFALPYWQFIPWVAANGLNVTMLVQQLFANRISSFFALDVLISSVVVGVFVGADSARLKINTRGLPLIALLTVGVSLALPLYLYMRELKLEKEQGGVRVATA